MSLTPYRRSALGFALAVAAVFAAPSLATAQASQADKLEKAQAELQTRFANADANHDGQLTREEANGKMPLVYKNFDAIDTAKKGYLTLDEIKSYAQTKLAERRRTAN